MQNIKLKELKRRERKEWKMTRWERKEWEIREERVGKKLEAPVGAKRKNKQRRKLESRIRRRKD